MPVNGDINTSYVPLLQWLEGNPMITHALEEKSHRQQPAVLQRCAQHYGSINVGIIRSKLGI